MPELLGFDLHETGTVRTHSIAGGTMRVNRLSRLRFDGAEVAPHHTVVTETRLIFAGLVFGRA
jgi:hypothetical protein